MPYKIDNCYFSWEQWLRNYKLKHHQQGFKLTFFLSEVLSLALDYESILVLCNKSFKLITNIPSRKSYSVSTLCGGWLILYFSSLIANHKMSLKWFSHFGGTLKQTDKFSQIGLILSHFWDIYNECAFFLHSLDKRSISFGKNVSTFLKNLCETVL